MGFLLAICYFIILLWIINKTTFFSDEIVPKNWFLGIFTLKIIFSVLLTLIYTYYYTDKSTSDIYKYFKDGEILYNALKNKPTDYFCMIFGMDSGSYFQETYYSKMSYWYRSYESNMFSDSHVIIRFNALIRLISLGNIYAHNLFINLFSFIGLTALFHFFKTNFNNQHKILFLGIFIIPSVLFWGSGLLKESFILFGVGLMLYITQLMCIQFKWYYLFYFIIAFVLILYTKYYVLATLLLPLLSYFLYYKLLNKNAVKSFSIAFSILIIIGLAIVFLFNTNPLEMIVSKHQEFFRFNIVFKSNSSFEIPYLIDWWSVIKHTPTAWLNTFLRPFVWEASSPLILISSLENFIFIGLLILSFVYPNANKSKWFTVVFCMIFVLSLFAISGLIVPIFGALVRYKVPAIPFLAVALLLLIDWERLKTKYPFLQKFI